MRIRLLGVLTAGALLGLSGCASNKASPTATATRAPSDISEFEQQIAERAAGSQYGKIAKLESGELVLDPYDPASGEATLALEEKTPVFEGDRQVGMSPEDALAAGNDVRVYFEARGDEPPLVLGIAKLDEEKAKEQMTQYGASDKPAAERFAGADGIQAGKVAKVSEDELVLEPYEGQAGEAELALGEEVTVVRDGVEVGRSALQEGSDVRVFFDLKGDEKPQVIGVEILPEDQARDLQKSEEGQPQEE